MTDEDNQVQPGKVQRIVGKFDFLSVIAAILILVALLSALAKD